MAQPASSDAAVAVSRFCHKERGRNGASDAVCANKAEICPRRTLHPEKRSPSFQPGTLEIIAAMPNWQAQLLTAPCLSSCHPLPRKL